MLSQNDVLSILLKDLNLEQHHVFNILHAYAYSKASRGNLPSEVLGKVLSIQRKLLLKRGPAAMNPSRQRAFDAMKSLLLQANRRWLELGPRAFGAVGQIGVASNVDARWCWTRATNGAIKDFPDGGLDGGRGMMNAAVPVLDAGRVIDPRFGYSDGSEGLPQYMPPTPPAVANGTNGTPSGPIGEPDEDDDARHAEIERREAEQAAQEDEVTAAATTTDGILTHHPDGTVKTKEEIDLERGKRTLARLREERLRREREQEEEEARRAREARDATAGRPLESPA